MFQACTFFLFSQTSSSKDSLKQLLRNATLDSIKVRYLGELAGIFEEEGSDSAGYYLNEAVKVAVKTNDSRTNIIAYNNLGLHYSNTGNYPSALEQFQASLKIAEKIKDPQETAYCLLYIGNLYMYQSNYPRALDFLQKSVKIFEEINETRPSFLIKKGLEMCYNDIGAIHAENGNFGQAIRYFNKALEVEELLGNQLVIAGCINNIGNVYYMQGDYPMAVEYYTKSLKIAEELKDKSSMSERYNNLGVVLTEMHQYPEAISYYEKSLAIDRELCDQKGVALVLGNISLLKIYLKQYPEAIRYALQSADIAKKIGSLDEEKCAYEYLATAYDSLKDYRKTSEYLKLFKIMNDSIFNIESARQVKEMEALYQTEKNQKEIELLNKEKELQQVEISRQEMQKYSFIAGFILMLLLSVVVFRSYTQKRKANILLTEQKRQIEEKNEELKQSNEEISAQRDEIESQRDLVTYQKEKIEDIHHQLTSSIHYAKRIQNAVLPSKETADSILKDYFILMKPRDIVSGDFFWFTVRRNYLLIAVADCTGHGVPGAFISMLGISFLNDIVARDDVTQANHVLNALREYVLNSMKQKGGHGEGSLSQTLAAGDVKDGMDIAFVCINLQPEINENGEEYYKAQFAGANNPLYIIKSAISHWPLAVGQGTTEANSQQPIANGQQPTANSQLIELKGDKMPISVYRNMSNFSNHEFELKKGDTIYLCSDGYCDQFGGPDNRKFLSKNFRNLLAEISPLAMEEQKIMLADRLDQWMHCNGNHYEQTDDITVMGIRF
jgi:serine phosphatase RsbU (regulator of sigma subunit)/tetratricopeptide (TPR) repeat protein